MFLNNKTIKHKKTEVIIPIIKAVVTIEDSFFVLILLEVLIAEVILLTTKGNPLETKVSNTI